MPGMNAKPSTSNPIAVQVLTTDRAEKTSTFLGNIRRGFTDNKIGCWNRKRGKLMSSLRSIVSNEHQSVEADVTAKDKPFATKSGQRIATRDSLEADPDIGLPVHVTVSARYLHLAHQQHDLHVSDKLDGLPPPWIQALRDQGLSEQDLVLIAAARQSSTVEPIVSVAAAHKHESSRSSAAIDPSPILPPQRASKMEQTDVLGASRSPLDSSVDPLGNEVKNEGDVRPTAAGPSAWGTLRGRKQTSGVLFLGRDQSSSEKSASWSSDRRGPSLNKEDPPFSRGPRLSVQLRCFRELQMSEDDGAEWAQSLLAALDVKAPSQHAETSQKKMKSSTCSTVQASLADAAIPTPFSPPDEPQSVAKQRSSKTAHVGGVQGSPLSVTNSIDGLSSDLGTKDESQSYPQGIDLVTPNSTSPCSGDRHLPVSASGGIASQLNTSKIISHPRTLTEGSEAETRAEATLMPALEPFTP